MAYVLVCIVALVASALTLFSGFGLGTLLLPAFALIFPVEIAVSATALVHLTNNLFKLTLVGRFAKLRFVLAFGLPAAAAALAGAWVLTRLAGLPALVEYTVGNRTCAVTPVGLAVAGLIFIFAVLDLLPAKRQITFPPRWISVGGVLSGFFGGLSGHQGALRSAFLINAGLTKEQFIGTGVTCAVLVDLSRLAVYGATFFTRHFAALGERSGFPLMIAATLCAFAGAFIGARLMKKVTLLFVQRLVGVLLILMALGLGSGLL